MPKFRPVLAALSTLALLAVRPARAWNGTGHEIIAQIAWQDLTPSAREKVTALLKSHANYTDMLLPPNAPPDDASRRVFLAAATWPDLVRTPGRPAYRYNHPAWHFIDFPFAVGVDPPAPPDIKWQPGKDPANAAQAWAKNVADLADPALPDPQHAMALCWIEHLAGDIHQPLHAVSFFSARLPKGDQGGNQLLVKVNNRTTNLHALWDELLGTDTSTDFITSTAARIRDAHPRADFDNELRTADFQRWIEGSAERAKVSVYQEGTLPFLTRDEMAKDKSAPVPELSEAYLAQARKTAELSAALAGYRLADRLNDWLGK